MPVQTRSQTKYKQLLNIMTTAYDPMHFCPSWCKCCQENLAKKEKIKTKQNKTL